MSGMWGRCLEVRRQLVEISSLLPPCEACWTQVVRLGSKDLTQEPPGQLDCDCFIKFFTAVIMEFNLIHIYSWLSVCLHVVVRLAFGWAHFYCSDFLHLSVEGMATEVVMNRNCLVLANPFCCFIAELGLLLINSRAHHFPMWCTVPTGPLQTCVCPCLITKACVWVDKLWTHKSEIKFSSDPLVPLWFG